MIVMIIVICAVFAIFSPGDSVQVYFHTAKGLTCPDIGLKDLSNERECLNALTYVRTFISNASYLGAFDRNLSLIKIINKSFNPDGCYITDSGAIFFNSPGRSRFNLQTKHDTRSICTRNIKKAPVNENCQADEIITIEERCKDVTKQLGLTYNFKIARGSKTHPRGCFYSYTRDQAWFNENVNRPTNPEFYGEFGGVCDSLGGLGGPCAHDGDCLFGACKIGNPYSCAKLDDPYSSSTCVTVGGKGIGLKCQFPFIYNKWNDYPYVPASFLRWFPNEIRFDSCTDFRNDGRLWCATMVTSEDRYIPGNWGECLDSYFCRTGKIDKEPCDGVCQNNRKIEWKRAMESSILR